MVSSFDKAQLVAEILLSADEQKDERNSQYNHYYAPPTPEGIYSIIQGNHEGW
jgi:hypothetical protein